MAGPVSAGPKPTPLLTVDASAPVPAATSAKVMIVKAGTQPYLYEDYALVQVSPFTRSGEVWRTTRFGQVGAPVRRHSRGGNLPTADRGHAEDTKLRSLPR